MRQGILKKYVSIFLICVIMSSLVLQNAYAFSLPVLGQNEKATASDAANTNTASRSDWGKLAGLGESNVLMAAASETTDFTSGNDMEAYVYIKNADESWVYDGTLECLSERMEKSDDSEDADDVISYFTAMEQMDENGEWMEAEFPEDVISYDADQLQEPELNGLALAPGIIYRMTYAYTMEECEEPKASSLEFRFKGTTESGANVTTKAQLYYNVDGWNLETIEAEMSLASDSDAEITVKVNGWQDLMDEAEEASASNAAEYAALNMNTLNWKLVSDAELEEIRQTDNGDGTVTFKFFYPDHIQAGGHMIQLTAKGSYKGNDYRSSESLIVLTDGEPAEEETERATEYQYEDDDVMVNAEVVSDNPEALPADSELVAEKITDPEQLEQIAQKILQETGQTYDCSHAYDIRFEQDGEEIEPADAVVKVQIQYKESVELNEAAKQDQQDVKLLHLTKDDTVEDVTDEISVDASGDVDAASFEATSFSIFVLTQTAEMKTEYQYENSEMLVIAKLSDASGIPTGAELVVDLIDEADTRYQDVKNQFSQMELTESQLLLCDFYLQDALERRITLNSDMVIELTIQYKNAEPSSDDIQQVSAYQMIDGKLTAVASNYNVSDNMLQTVSTKTSHTGIMMFSVKLAGAGEHYISSEHPERTYELYYILNHFNAFIRNNAHLNHSVGALAVGNNLKLNQGAIGGASTGPTYALTTNSYIGGTLSFEDVWTTFQSYNPQGSGSRLYVNNNDNKKIADWLINAKKVAINPGYLDMDAAFADIQNEADEIAALPGKDIYSGGDITLESGYIYHIKNIGSVGRINVNDNSSIKKGNAVIIIEDAGTVQLKGSVLNGSNLIASTEVGNSGTIYILPNATEVEITTTDNFLGHIVAPKASVTKSKSNLAGCVVSNNFTFTSENHMWPIGTIELNTSTSFNFGKLINGTKPQNNETFSFQLEELKYQNGSYLKGTLQSTVKNDTNGSIQFTTVEEPYEKEGTYYYLVHEVPDSANNQAAEYKYDTKYYYIEVEVEASGEPDRLISTKYSVTSKKVWEWKCAAGDVLNGQPVGEPIDMLTSEYNEAPATFNNTNGQVILPETGGTGLTMFMSLGVWMFLFGMIGITAVCTKSRIF